MENKKTKDIPNINSVTDHYQKVMGTSNKIYYDQIGKCFFALFIGVLIISFGLGLFSFHRLKACQGTVLLHAPKILIKF